MSKSISTDETFGQLKKIHPDYQKALRIVIGAWAFVVLTILGVTSIISDAFILWIAFVILSILFLFLFFIYPKKVYKYTHYGLIDEVFYVQRGWIFKKRTAVSQNRIQHSDVEQGPSMRKYELAQLILHTAGVKEADISISGLQYSEAIEIRDYLLDLNKQTANKKSGSKEQVKNKDLEQNIKNITSSLYPTEASLATSVLSLHQDLPSMEEE